MNEMNEIIYDIFQSEDELDKKIRDARKKYGHNPRSLEFINSVDHNENLLCATIIQCIFSVGYCTTLIGESWNSRIKGRGELKMYVATATLYTLINVLDRMARSQYVEAVKILKQLHELEMRWSFFQNHYDHFNMLAGSHVLEVRVAEL